MHCCANCSNFGTIVSVMSTYALSEMRLWTSRTASSMSSLPAWVMEPPGLTNRIRASFKVEAGCAKCESNTSRRFDAPMTIPRVPSSSSLAAKGASGALLSLTGSMLGLHLKSDPCRTFVIFELLAMLRFGLRKCFFFWVFFFKLGI